MESQKVDRKPYETPAVVYEAPLEVRAGSPLIIDALHDLLDPGNPIKW